MYWSGLPEEDGISQLNKRRKIKGGGQISPASTFCFNQMLKRLDDAHLHWGGTIYFTKFTVSNSNLIQKHLHGHTQETCLICAPGGPVKLIHKIYHHAWYRVFHPLVFLFFCFLLFPSVICNSRTVTLLSSLKNWSFNWHMWCIYTWCKHWCSCVWLGRPRLFPFVSAIPAPFLSFFVFYFLIQCFCYCFFLVI